MQQPETPLGRILAEQARQDIPDTLDGWPSILVRLQSEGLLNGSETPAEPLMFQATGPEPEPTPTTEGIISLKPKLSEPARLKQRRNLALAGLGLAAMLAIFVISISVILSGAQTPVSPASTSVQAVQTGEAPVPTTAPVAASPTISASPTTAPTATTAPGPTAAPVSTPTAPPVAGLNLNAGNFSKQGKLAFIFQGNLFILDSSTGQNRQITNSGAVGNFAWSYDGEWLAYSWRADANSGTNTLWMTLADGSGKHQIPPWDEFAWSPTANEIALTQPGNNTGLEIVDTANTARMLTNLNATSPVWSADGSTLAFVTTDRGPNGAAKIMTMPAKGGSPTIYYTGQAGDGLKLLGWWPNGNGLLFQTIPANSASLSADGLAVQSLALTTPASAPQTLVKSLVHAEWLSWAPDGTRFVAVEGAGRQISSNKSLTVCDVTKGSCQAIAQPANTVSLDPAWSPDGSRIAFVRNYSASNFASASGDAAAFAAWEKTRTLWVLKLDGSNVRMVDGLDGVVGVQNPQWSKDGKQLLLGHTGGTAQSGLWLAELSEQGGKLQATPRLVAGPVGVAQPGYYGYQDWTAIAAWYR